MKCSYFLAIVSLLVSYAAETLSGVNEARLILQKGKVRCINDSEIEVISRDVTTGKRYLQRYAFAKNSGTCAAGQRPQRVIIQDGRLLFVEKRPQTKSYRRCYDVLSSFGKFLPGSLLPFE